MGEPRTFCTAISEAQCYFSAECRAVDTVSHPSGDIKTYVENMECAVEILGEKMFEKPSEFRLPEQSEFMESLGLSNILSLEFLSKRD